MCLSKHVEQLKNTEIINSPTRSHLVDYFYTICNYQHLIISKVLFLLTLLEIFCILFISLYLKNEFAGRQNKTTCTYPFLTQGSLSSIFGFPSFTFVIFSWDNYKSSVKRFFLHSYMQVVMIFESDALCCMQECIYSRKLCGL